MEEGKEGGTGVGRKERKKYIFREKGELGEDFQQRADFTIKITQPWNRSLQH